MKIADCFNYRIDVLRTKGATRDRNTYRGARRNAAKRKYRLKKRA